MNSNTTNSTLPTDEELAQTETAKSFQAFVNISNLMARYNFDLRVTRAGRIYIDPKTDMKVRRKLVKGQPDQNAVFEAYRQEGSNNVVKSTLTLGDEAFTPSMAIAATAAHLANSSDTAATRIAILFLQAASAIVGENSKEVDLVNTKFNAENDPQKAEYYNQLQDLTARSYSVTAISDILQYVVGDNPNLYCLSDSLEFASKVTDEKYGDEAELEFHHNKNLLLAAISTLAMSKPFKDIQLMADEIVSAVGEAAAVELSDAEQKLS